MEYSKHRQTDFPRYLQISMQEHYKRSNGHVAWLLMFGRKPVRILTSTFLLLLMISWLPSNINDTERISVCVRIQ